MFQVRTTISHGRRRRHLAVTPGKNGWYLQWALPTVAGYRYDQPIAGPFKTKREARDGKRWMAETA